MLEQRADTQWHTGSTGRQSSNGEPNIDSSIKRTSMDVKNSTLIDNTPTPAPLSPPTSPPLAVATTVIHQADGKITSDIPLVKSFNTGRLGHVTTTSARGWFQTLAASLPSYTFTTANPSRRVAYLRKRDSSSAHSVRVRKSGVSVVGFDLEWKPMRDGSGEYNKVSLVQVATPDEILLIQLPESSKFPLGLRALLEDPTILKVGAGIQNDVDKLKRDWKVDVKNYLDLAFVARYHDYFWDTCDVLNSQCLEGAFGGTWCNGTECDVSSADGSDSVTHKPLEQQYGRPVYPMAQPVALARLVARYLGTRLDKECQLSNWAAPLNENQIQYAANDGYSSLDVYNALVRLRDRTPGWVEAQATFYRMIIESQRSAMSVHQHQSMVHQVQPSTPTPATSSDEETVFAMDGDEATVDNATESTSQQRTTLLHLLKQRQPTKAVPTSAPTLHRSLSDTNVKFVGATSGVKVKQEKVELGPGPLYPSPPVTPTHPSLPSVPLSSPSTVSKSAPVSPLSIAHLSLADSPTENVEMQTTSHPLASGYPKVTPSESLPIGQYRSEPTRAAKQSKRSANWSAKSAKSAPLAAAVVSFTTHTLPARPPPPSSVPVPVPTLYSGSLPSRAPLAHRASASYSVPPAHEYLPPTPATPYAAQNPYDAPIYPPLPYPPGHAYPYPPALPYNNASYAYGPYYPPQAQPYYAWNPPATNYGWVAPIPAALPSVVPPPPAEPFKKRPSLRFTSDGWCSIRDTMVATRAPANGGKTPSLRVGTTEWVRPMPDGVPTPQLETDVRNGLTNGELPANPATEPSPHGRTLFIGDVALDSDLYSENVRFN